MTRARATKDETPQAPPPEAGVADETKPNGAADEALPSAEPGNVADLASFAEDDDDPIRQNIRRVRCSVSRPDNFTRFRTHPDKSWWRIYHFLIRDGGGSSMHFLVHPNLVALDELEGRTKRKRLIPYVTLAGGLGFWPMGTDDSNGYVSSGLYICEQATREWACAVTRGREDGEYLYKPPVPGKRYGQPNWPEDLTLNDMLNLAFPRDRQILDRDHAELVKLREDD